MTALAATGRDTGRSPYCGEGGHEFCHPQDVYVQLPGRPRIGPVFTIRCSCPCHQQATR
ncbi:MULTISPECIES: hypothetical protein [Streptomyces]|uniref:Uncharacterized protein n=1 Tax=Streptomyces fradiae ATCC 10745 = DSM 40063 TaxID=1319510 RepID=A0A1Y2NXU5_STRFR|nr:MULTISPECIES: hypothetical protein [Streptomyces]KAF0649227.1 hypothetical protein K701_14060 [Streptomyces fradiae ATCC 10745 = DSM 40063]OSY51857.1 hypothetical protein BG846_02531 [Streptomyces fradiae ATCC 10745 = DSM 40063]